MASLPLMDRLRTMIRPVHRNMDKLPYCQALLKGELPLGSYQDFLRSQAIMLGALEHAMSTSEDEDLVDLQRHCGAKLPWILDDLNFLGALDSSFGPAPLLLAHQIATKIRRQSWETPLSLLGFFYVFEGSANGGQLLEKCIRKGFGFQGERGCRYLKGYGDLTGDHWDGVVCRLEKIMESKGCYDLVSSTALSLFLDLENLYRHLYPLSPQNPPPDLVSLNPEAGMHSIPANVNMIRLAMRANRISMERYPYYDIRYGERGRRFGDSDGAWVVQLMDTSEEEAFRQLNWLRGILVSRGMPSCLLLDHVEVLVGEFLSEDLKTREDILKLERANARLYSQCLLEDSEALQLEMANMDAQLSEFSECFVGLGRLIASAKRDAQRQEGLGDAGFLTWLKTSSHFSDSCREVISSLL